jgi:hypothetical protein
MNRQTPFGNAAWPEVQAIDASKGGFGEGRALPATLSPIVFPVIEQKFLCSYIRQGMW